MTCGGEFLKCFCVLAVLGLASSVKIDISRFNATALHKPHIKSTVQSAQFVWDPDFCNDFDDWESFPHPDNCYQFLMCWEGALWEMECDPGELFDPWTGFCEDEEYVECLDNNWPDYPDPDAECPPAGSDEIRFLPSHYCEEYYICINGWPVLMHCRPGQHWNVWEEFCDDPENAGCEVSWIHWLRSLSNFNYEQIEAEPEPLPDCVPLFVGQLPHPHNCNWFIHCNHGSRTIQQCQHLHHFDIVTNRCVFLTLAQCANGSMNRR